MIVLYRGCWNAARIEHSQGVETSVMDHVRSTLLPIVQQSQCACNARTLGPFRLGMLMIHFGLHAFEGRLYCDGNAWHQTFSISQTLPLEWQVKASAYERVHGRCCSQPVSEMRHELVEHNEQPAASAGHITKLLKSIVLHSQKQLKSGCPQLLQLLPLSGRV